MSRRATPKRESECVLFLGPKGSGKSYRAKREVDALRGPAPVLIFDPKGEWTGPAADSPVRGATRFASVAELARWIVQHNPRLEGRRLVIQPPRVKVPPRRGRAQPLPPHHAELERLCNLAAEAGDCWLVIDEAATYCRASVIPEALRELLQVSRHHRVNTMFCAQRPTHLHPDIRDNLDRAYLFRMHGEASLAWVRNSFGKSVESACCKLLPRCYVLVRAGASDSLLSDGSGGSRPARQTPRRRPRKGNP